jgi:hypothetical protein
MELVAVGAELVDGAAAFLQRPVRRAIEKAERVAAKVPGADGLSLPLANLIPAVACIGGRPWASIVVVALQSLADDIGTHGLLGHPGCPGGGQL